MLFCDRTLDYFTLLLLSSTALAVTVALPTHAQIIPDNSLKGESSIVTPNTIVKDRPADLIEGGAIRDINLFHSFSEFNLSNGSAVYFASPDGIANILTRVTGNNTSNIFGTVGVLKDTASHIDGAANLFLLNPNGIVFGENAALDVNGSFFATTAESYIFDQQEAKFSATVPGTAPLLNVNLLPGLQMGDSSGKIIVQGNGHSLIGGNFFPFNYDDTPTGLQVSEGETLGLIGSQIDLTGGIIRTLGGNVQLSSVEEGKIKLDRGSTNWQFDTSQVERFGDIQLSDRTLVDTSGIITGDIQLQGKNISIEDGSAIIIQNLGSEASGKITVNASGSMRLLGSIRTAPDTPTPLGTLTGIAFSRLSTETLGTGTAGDILVSSDNLFLLDGGRIASRTFSNADTGNIAIDIEELIEVKNYSPLSPSFFASIISTTTLDTGNAGKIDVSAKNIDILEGGTISSINFGSGQGGEVQVNVDENLVINGINPKTLAPSNVASAAFKQGNSGSLTINTARLSVSDRAVIVTSTLASGSAGQLIINASEYIKLTSLNDGDPKFALSTSGIGSDARIADPIFRQFTGVPDMPSGNSGNIYLNTPTLMISDGAELSVSNQGLGDSGDLQISAKRVLLDTKGKISAFSASGQGGNINLNIDDSLLLNNSSFITAETTGTSANSQFNVDGGNIAIDADTVTLLNNSRIIANAIEGKGGNIKIATQGYFVSGDSSVSASSEFGLDGNIEVEYINGDRKIELDTLPENTINATEQITTGCGANDDFTVVGQGGLPTNPTQNLSGQVVWQDIRTIPHLNSNIEQTRSDNPKVNRVNLQGQIVEAQAWKLNELGKVELFAQNSTDFVGNHPKCDRNS